MQETQLALTQGAQMGLAIKAAFDDFGFATKYELRCDNRATVIMATDRSGWRSRHYSTKAAYLRQ